MSKAVNFVLDDIYECVCHKVYRKVVCTSVRNKCVHKNIFMNFLNILLKFIQTKITLKSNANAYSSHLLV